MEFTLAHFTSLAEDAIAHLSYPTVAPGLYAPVAYTMASGGKRLRPSLCMAAYSALTHSTPEPIVKQAIAIEMFHNFTLLHDDVMDKADLRRGRPTVHRRWSENAAILSGDAMLTLAYTLLAEGADTAMLPRTLALFNKTADEVYQGQQLDMEFESRTTVSVDEYLTMIRLKTSVLTACACRMGALLAGAPEEVCDAFYTYGEALGMAFQLADDWLDTFGDPAVFGKEIGGDIVNRKKTWLLINALNEDYDEVSSILAEDLTEDELIRQVTRRYKALKLDQRCRALADKYSATAIEALAGVEIDNNARIFFDNLARTAANRTH